MQERRAQRLGVETHPGADLGHPNRVDDELLTRLTPLVGMVLAGINERILDPPPVNGERRRVSVLLDDREQVGEELALEGRELGLADCGACLSTLVDVIYELAGLRDECLGASVATSATAVATTASLPPVPGKLPASRSTRAGARQALGRRFALLRNRRPSSCRCA